MSVLVLTIAVVSGCENVRFRYIITSQVELNVFSVSITRARDSQ